MKNLLMLLSTAALALCSTATLAQSTTPAPDANTAAKPTGKETMDAHMNMQKNKPSKQVKNENVPPKPDASKMTPEERAQYRKDVVKEAKP